MRIKINTALGILGAFLALGAGSCREDYIPPSITTDYDYLVVEGYINIGADSSFFILSRTQPPGQSNASAREKNAVLTLLDEGGAVAATAVEKPNGEYAFGTAGLTTAGSYQLKIMTTDSQEYLSDAVKGKVTPAIDSISWKFDPSARRINFFANTHDVSGNTRYYRWDYVETWEYRSLYNSHLEFDGNQDTVLDRPADRQVYTCWGTEASSGIIIGSSAALSQDLVSAQDLYYVPYGTRRLNVRYSVLVNQYALTEDAYSYWQSLKRMNEQGGSIFDAQPTELIGNYRCTTDPTVPVIGYLSAHTVSQQRIFIPGGTVLEMMENYPRPCADTLTSDQNSVLRNLYADGGYVPVGPGNLTGTVLGSSVDCVDCRSFGGVTTKPSFW